MLADAQLLQISIADVPLSARSLRRSHPHCVSSIAGQEGAAVHHHRGGRHKSGPQTCATAHGAFVEPTHTPSQQLPVRWPVCIVDFLAWQQCYHLSLTACHAITSLAVMSLRLGCGKGGVRLAPDDLLTSVLQVGGAGATDWCDHRYRCPLGRPTTCLQACCRWVLQ